MIGMIVIALLVLLLGVMAIIQYSRLPEACRNAALSQDNQQLLQENDTLRQRNEKYVKETEELRIRLRELVRQCDENDDKYQYLERQKSSVEQDIATGKHSLAELNEQIKESEARRNELDGEVSVLQTQKEALFKEIDCLKASLEKSRQAAEGGETDAARMLKDLWEPLEFPALSLQPKPDTEQQMLEKTHEYIRGRGLYFPKRILYAFHTALKSNDISPLTVLAGISGTGKSELPKCYAEGMGMHFAMLAVQPRWDSPQDLLGFYNYMESKYKATEFSRALIRFDRYNRASWGKLPPECDDRSDRMLLLLLDEMNLARVEYYFSEFLSKLELRRGLQGDDAAARAKAEIELELLGRRPLRIFADRNVLFTGTMNEDETTQALSDKVLDRANVLRFGRPKDMDLQEKLKKSKPQAPAQHGLAYATWQSWCKEAQKAAGATKQLKLWIGDLNEAMTVLGRPFGYRVANAMQTYVANYPVVNCREEESRRRAFADQIEQRVLPKLRGVGIEGHEEAFRKIGKLISEMKDERLEHAYEASQDKEMGVFHWQGVDRSDEE